MAKNNDSLGDRYLGVTTAVTQVPVPTAMVCPHFICLRIDAGGTLEVAAEIGGGGEAELVGSLLDRLLRMRVHDELGLRRHILLYPFQGREADRELAEYF